MERYALNAQAHVNVNLVLPNVIKYKEKLYQRNHNCLKE